MIVICTECHAEFDRIVPHQQRCGKADCERAATRRRVQEYRKRHRRNGGGGGGNGGGGGESPMLFDDLNLDPKTVAVILPDTCYRTPEKEPVRKPAVTVTGLTQQALKAAA